MVSPASATPDAPAADMVSRSEYSNLQEQLSRAEGRAKASQRLSSAAESLGYSDPNQLADYLQQSAAQQKQYQDQVSQYQQQQYAQQYYPQGYQQQQPQQSSVTPQMIDSRINQHIGVSQANSSHELHREAEQNFINQMITNPEMAKIFEGVEAGEHGNVFNAAYSGAGSAASEIIASAIDNAIYGLSTQYGDDAPERLRGRSMPINDPETFQKVQNRVMEGLKELSAMSVFAATQKGMSDPPPADLLPVNFSGDELSNSEAKEKRAKEISGFIQSSYDDMSPGLMSDTN
jgi:hypothetical protein